MVVVETNSIWARQDQSFIMRQSLSTSYRSSLKRAKHRWCLFASSLVFAFAMQAGLATAAVPADDLIADDGRALNYTPVPIVRPDVALSYGGVPVDIAVPVMRPSMEEAFGTSTATLVEMAILESSSQPTSEDVFALQSGETLSKLLSRAGFDKRIAANVISQLSKRLNVRRLQIGMAFTVAFEDDQPKAVHFKSSDGFDHYILHDDEQGWFGFRTLRPVERYLVYASGEITGTIYEAVGEQNVPYAALDEFVRVLGFSVDFQREVRSGDEFELLYERRLDKLTGEELGAGTLHYAGLRLSGDAMSFFRYEQGDGIVGWYDEEGNSAVRTLMRTPIKGAKMSSKYGMRKHPITGYNAMHRGVDFGAPMGTPIVAAGSGVVERANWFGNYGRYIRIRHTGRYSTAYAHMTRIANGVTAGARVKQGQVIGYVGSTGRSTGPHLHYEVLVNNKQVNPMTVKLPSGESLPADELAEFDKIVKNVAFEITSRGQSYFAANSSE